MELKSRIVFAVAWLLVGAGFLLSQDLMRVTQETAMKSVVKKVTPEYPAMAKQMKLAGQTEVDLYVAEDGAVEKVDVVKGNPILANAAVAAAKQWKFQPFETEGTPRKAVVRLSFSFQP